MTRFPVKWSLDTIFLPPKAAFEIDEIKGALTHLEKDSSRNFLTKIETLQQIKKRVAELESYAICLSAENTESEKGPLLEASLKSVQATFQKLLLKLLLEIRELNQSDRDQLLNESKNLDLDFFLKEQLDLAENKLSFDQESTIIDLEVDGYHGFSQLYHVLHGSLRFSFKKETLSYSQLENLLHAQDKKIRDEAFKSYLTVFKQNQQLFAQILNHIGGFRLEVYKKRGWDSFLYEPLIQNRIKEKTLKAMWGVISSHLSSFSKYLQKKASLLHLKSLDWQDIETPLFKDENLKTYDEACQLIIDEVSKYGPCMGAFCEKALKSSWVEAENRNGKAAGGFCTPVPIKKESRIFMTFLGTDSNVATLAHELGHAFHNEVLFSLPYFLQDVKMNLAETASTMFEIIVSQGLLEKAKSKEAKLSILDERISRSIAFFMNISSRFLFETRFYAERKKGCVSPEQLCHLMEISQKEAYQHSIGSYNPLFWASKMHFYFTEVPFYNFPYTFGYLFSLGLFAHLCSDEQLETKYINLLKDSSSMSTEELAKKHLGIDLEKPYFWELAIKQATKDVELFLELI